MFELLQDESTGKQLEGTSMKVTAEGTAIVDTKDEIHRSQVVK